MKDRAENASSPAWPGVSGRVPGGALFFVLLALAVLHCVNNYVFLLQDSTPPIADELTHMEYSLRFYHCIQDGRWADFFINHPRDSYPPLQYYLAAAAYTVTGPSYVAGVMVQSIFVLILALFIYLAARSLWGDWIGFLAGLASICSPLMVYLGHRMRLDIALCGMLAMSVYFLLATRQLSRPRMLYPFFIACALGALAKLTFVLYVIVPFIFILKDFFTERAKDPAGRKELAAWSLSLFAAAAIAFKIADMDVFLFPDAGQNRLLIYFLSIIPLCAYLAAAAALLKSRPTGPLFQGAALFLLLIWGYYGMNAVAILTFASAMVKWGAEFYRPVAYNLPLFLHDSLPGTFGVPLSLFLAAGIAHYAIYQKKTPEKNAIFFGFLALMAQVFLTPLRDNRYSLAGIAFAAPFMACWIPTVKKPFNAILAAILILSCIWAALGFRLAPDPQRSFRQNLYFDTSDFHFTPPGPARLSTLQSAPPEIRESLQKFHWNINEILNSLIQARQDDSSILILLWGKDTPDCVRHRNVFIGLQYKSPRRLARLRSINGITLQNIDWGHAISLAAAWPPNPAKGFNRIIILTAGTEIPPSLTTQLHKIGMPPLPAPVTLPANTAPITFNIFTVPLKNPIPSQDILLDPGKPFWIIEAPT